MTFDTGLLKRLAISAALASAAILATAWFSAADAACVRGVAANDVLNIRNGATAQARIVGFLRPGQCGVRTGRRQGNWIWVDHGRGGFVAARYLSLGSGGGGPDFRCVRGVMEGDVLNIRRRPNAGAGIVGYLSPWECSIRVVGRSGRWARVRTRNGNGWVNGRYLTAAD